MGLIPDVHRGGTLTRADYYALEAAGKITRPLTSPTMRRHATESTFAPQTPTKGRDTQTGRLS